MRLCKVNIAVVALSLALTGLARADIATLRSDAQRGDANRQCQLAEAYWGGEGVTADLTKAAEWARKAAEQGHARAQHMLSVFYLTGWGDVPQDLSESVRWSGKAARQGHAGAQTDLGTAYELGWGISEDIAEAVKWYQKAVDQGDAGGQYSLAMLYFIGNGVPQSDSEAARLFGLSAEQDHDVSQYELAKCYLEGIGVGRDSISACAWFLAASFHANEAAEICVGEIVQMLTSSQVDSVKVLASAIQDRIASSRGE